MYLMLHSLWMNVQKRLSARRLRQTKGLTCGELCRHHVRVSGYQRGYDPRVAVASYPYGMGHLEDRVGLFFCAVEKNDRALELLQLVLDL